MRQTMLSLPIEINHMIFSYLTNPVDIISLMKTNSKLSRLVSQIVTRLTWNGRCLEMSPLEKRGIPVNFVLKFPNLNIVDMCILINTEAELMALAETKLQRAVFEISKLELLYTAKKSRNTNGLLRDILNYFNTNEPMDRSQKINLIAIWFMQRMLHPPHHNKKFIFISPPTAYYLTIKDGGLDYMLGGKYTISTMYSLMRAIDLVDGLHEISHDLHSHDDIARLADFPRLDTLLINFPNVKLNDYFNLTHINKVKLRRGCYFIDRIADLTKEMIYRTYKHHIIEGDLYLELPVYPIDIPKILEMYPNIREIGVMLYFFTSFDLRFIHLLVERGVRIIIYTPRDIDLSIPMTTYRRVDNSLLT